MDGILIVDLTISDKEINLICNDLKLNKKIIFELKNGFSFHKIWISKINSEYKLIAYKRNHSKNIEISNDLFGSIKSYKPTVKEEVLFLSVDDILDKIAEFGMDSLSDKELNFLKENS